MMFNEEVVQIPQLEPEPEQKQPSPKRSKFHDFLDDEIEETQTSEFERYMLFRLSLKGIT